MAGAISLHKVHTWCLLQVKLCDPCLSALKWSVYHARRYTSALLFYKAEAPHKIIVKAEKLTFCEASADSEAITL